MPENRKAEPRYRDSAFLQADICQLTLPELVLQLQRNVE